MFAILSGVSACLLSGAINGIIGGWLLAVAALSNPLLLGVTFAIGATTAAAIERIEKATEVQYGSNKSRLAY